MDKNLGALKAYSAPKLMKWGSVKDLTQTKGGNVPDAGVGGSSNPLPD